MKKLIIVLCLALSLTAIPFLPTFANTDVGLSQDSIGNTSFRLDSDIFLASVPLNNKSLQDSWITVGGKLQTPIQDLYGLGAVDFSPNTSEKKLNLGVGYPIQWNNTTIRAEVSINNPKWNNFSKWKPNISVSIQFNILELFNNSE